MKLRMEGRGGKGHGSQPLIGALSLIPEGGRAFTLGKVVEAAAGTEKERISLAKEKERIDLEKKRIDSEKERIDLEKSRMRHAEFMAGIGLRVEMGGIGPTTDSSVVGAQWEKVVVKTAEALDREICMQRVAESSDVQSLLSGWHSASAERPAMPENQMQPKLVQILEKMAEGTGRRALDLSESGVLAQRLALKSAGQHEQRPDAVICGPHFDETTFSWRNVYLVVELKTKATLMQRISLGQGVRRGMSCCEDAGYPFTFVVITDLDRIVVLRVPARGSGNEHLQLRIGPLKLWHSDESGFRGADVLLSLVRASAPTLGRSVSATVAVPVRLGDGELRRCGGEYKKFDPLRPRGACVCPCTYCSRDGVCCRCVVKMVQDVGGAVAVLEREEEALKVWDQCRQQFKIPLMQLPVLVASGSVTVEDVGTCPALVIRPVGKTLSDLMDDKLHGIAMDRSSIGSVLFKLTEDMLQALEAAHGVGKLCRGDGSIAIVHRDISPKNIVAVNETGSDVDLGNISHFVLSDWGASSEVGEVAWEPGWVGTVPFMPRKMLEAKAKGDAKDYNGRGPVDDLESLLHTLKYFVMGECGLMMESGGWQRPAVMGAEMYLEGRRHWDKTDERQVYLLQNCGDVEVAEFLLLYMNLLDQGTDNLIEKLMARIVGKRAGCS